MTVVLVDTSVWIDHFRQKDADLVALLEANLVSTHPMVIGELALGNLTERAAVLTHLSHLPQAAAATHEEVLRAIDQRSLAGSGLSLVDVHLLAAALISPHTRLWTHDRRLAFAAETASIAWQPNAH